MEDEHHVGTRMEEIVSNADHPLQKSLHAELAW